MKMKLQGFTIVSLALLAGAGVALAQQAGSKPILSAAPTPAPLVTTAPAAPSGGNPTVSPDYIIGADDQLKIDVWGNTQLSTVLPVRPDGKISMTLVNDVMAAGLTPNQLAADLTARLTKFLVDPTVGVTVMGVNSKRVFMVGEVGRPGPLELTPGMTMLQALATTGLTPYASRKHIYILRGDPAHPRKVYFDYNKALKKGDMQGVTLIPGDTIVVP
jgi:polysaccharide export outer membrane protein